MGFLDRLVKRLTSASFNAPKACPKCKSPIESPGTSFCPKCGEALLKCPECGGNWYVDNGGVRLCSICGAKW